MKHIWKCIYATKRKNEREIKRKEEDEKNGRKGRERERKGSDRECESRNQKRQKELVVQNLPSLTASSST